MIVGLRPCRGSQACCDFMKERGEMERSKTQRLGLNGLWIPCSPGDPGTLGGGMVAGPFGSPPGSSWSLLQEATAIGGTASALQNKGSMAYFG